MGDDLGEICCACCSCCCELICDRSNGSDCCDCCCGSDGCCAKICECCGDCVTSVCGSCCEFVCGENGICGRACGLFGECLSSLFNCSCCLKEGACFCIRDICGRTCCYACCRVAADVAIAPLGTLLNASLQIGSFVLHPGIPHDLLFYMYLYNYPPQHTGGRYHRTNVKHHNSTRYAEPIYYTGGYSVSKETDDPKLLLFKAAATDDEGLAKWCIEQKGVSINSRDMEQRTPLIVACHANSLSVFSYLILNSSLDLNAKDNYGQTALHYAVVYGVYDMFSQIVWKEGLVDLNAIDMDGVSPITAAIMHKKSGAVDLLLRSSSVDLGITDFNGNTLMHVIVAVNNISLLSYALSNRKLQFDTPNVHGKTPLFIAVESNFMELASALLAQHCNVHVQLPNGENMLSTACRTNNLPMVQLLLQYGADPRYVLPSGETLFHIICYNGNAAMKQLLEQFLPTDSKHFVYQDGRTLMHDLCRSNNNELFDSVYTAQPDLCNMKSASGSLPLHEACMFGNAYMARQLLQAYPDSISVFDEDGKNALHYALSSGSTECCALLLNTPGLALDYTHFAAAVRSGNVGNIYEVFKAVCAGKDSFDPNATYDGYTIVQLACYSNKWEALDFVFNIVGVDSSVYINEPPGYLCTMNGNCKMLEILVQNHRDHMYDTWKDRNCMAVACENGVYDIVSYLMNQGYSQVDQQNVPYLYIAIRSHKNDVAKKLLNYHPSGAATDNDGNSPMHIAVESRNYEIMHLLEDFAVYRYDKSLMFNRLGCSPLHTAVLNADYEAFETCIALYPEALRVVYDKHTPLQAAYTRELHSMVFYIIHRCQSFLDVVAFNEPSLSHILAQYNSAEIKATHNYTLDVNARLNNMNAFEWAIFKDNLYMVQQLLPHYMAQSQTSMVLHLAVQHSSLEVVKFVIANFSTQLITVDKNGDTPLHVASRLGEYYIIQELLKKNNNACFAVNYKGQTPKQVVESLGPDYKYILNLFP